jgi:hypothetical protein
MCSVNVQFVCIQCISLKNSLLLIAKTQCDFSEEYFLIITKTILRFLHI